MISEFLATPKGSAVLVGSMCSASFFAGGALAYVLTKRSLEAKYEQIIAEEIAEAKAFYSKLNKKEEFADPTKLVTPYQEVVEELGYGKLHGEDLAAESERFMERINEEIEDITEHDEIVTEDGFDYKAEMANRTPEKPYIIHHDEFFENEQDYPQVSLTYFEEDDILVDEKDSPIPDVEGTVGQENLRFGHGSKDNNIVYIRNERLELDFEVIRNKGNYAKEVLGFIEHSEKIGRPRKFRRDYE